MTLFALNSGSELGFLSLEIWLFGCNVALLSIFGHKIAGSFAPRKTAASYTLQGHVILLMQNTDISWILHIFHRGKLLPQ